MRRDEIRGNCMTNKMYGLSSVAEVNLSKQVDVVSDCCELSQLEETV